jgi:hypothetical protein
VDLRRVIRGVFGARNTSELDRVAATSMANVRAQMPKTTTASRGSSVQGRGPILAVIHGFN